MTQEILVNVTAAEVRVALLEDGILQEIHIERSLSQGLLGNIYKGRVTRLLPGIQAAFVDIDLDRSAFLHVSDMNLVPQVLTTEEIVYPDIREVITPGQEIIVQVYKNPLGSKGARLSAKLTIPSRYLVLTPGIPQVAVSQKITNEDEQARLMSMISPSEKDGYIFRTAAEGVSQAEVDADKSLLDSIWVKVEKQIKEVKPPKIVFEELPIVLRVLRDLAGFNVKKISVDLYEAAQQMKEYAQKYIPQLENKIEYYAENTPIFDLYAVEDELKKALTSKLFLPSGGHVVFDQTEAMTTIDINTGSYIGKDNLEHTVFKTNLESIDIIARQIRLRNLGGIIIIDFIDMADPVHKEQLLEALKLAVSKDSTKTQVSEVSSLGLVQMTRKRTRESLEHILCAVCPLCQNRGSIKSVKTICYEIFREIKRISSFPGVGFVVVASPVVINELKNDEANLLAGLEMQFNKPINLRAESTYGQEHYDVFLMP
ncbi:MAG: ribonuclease G [Gammaproteobacteria bacterium]|nr:ribonuclease G [Gammaproteobacteria bacterium]